MGIEIFQNELTYFWYGAGGYSKVVTVWAYLEETERLLK